MSEEKQHVIVVREQGELWAPTVRCASVKDAQQWLKQTAEPGLYHILAFRYEDVEVKEAPPAPTRNVVEFGVQHITRTRGEGEGAAE